MDKAVATDADFQGESEWIMVQLESLLGALVHSKVVAMKSNHRPNYLKQQPLREHHKRHKYCKHGDNRFRSKSAIYKVRQWDDGSTILVLDKNRMTDQDYIEVDIDDIQTHKRLKRKRIKNIIQIHQTVPVVKVVDPEELPKRARWTIIITAGFLLLTCMLLVGITLRMAPIIDEMVHNQNEELMNSLNRQEFNESDLNLMT